MIVLSAQGYVAETEKNKRALPQGYATFACACVFLARPERKSPAETVTQDQWIFRVLIGVEIKASAGTAVWLFTGGLSLRMSAVVVFLQR